MTDEEALQAFQTLARLEGILPALESSHAIAYVQRLARRSGRRDPARQPVGPRRQGCADGEKVDLALSPRRQHTETVPNVCPDACRSPARPHHLRDGRRSGPASSAEILGRWTAPAPISWRLASRSRIRWPTVP